MEQIENVKQTNYQHNKENNLFHREVPNYKSLHYRQQKRRGILGKALQTNFLKTKMSIFQAKNRGYIVISNEETIFL